MTTLNFPQAFRGRHGRLRRGGVPPLLQAGQPRRQGAQEVDGEGNRHGQQPLLQVD